MIVIVTYGQTYPLNILVLLGRCLHVGDISSKVWVYGLVETLAKLNGQFLTRFRGHLPLALGSLTEIHLGSHNRYRGTFVWEALYVLKFTCIGD